MRMQPLLSRQLLPTKIHAKSKNGKEPMMDFQEYIKFANENPVCYLATAEGDQPRVRPMAILFADDKGFYFQTSSVKSLCKELQNNKKVDLCFYAPGTVQKDKVLRVSGKVEFVNDMKLKEKTIAERPYLKETGMKGPEDPRLVIFRVYTGEAYFWTMAYSSRESEIEKTRF
jgi:uncharacterized pyridoxamine 5'-phosphate oxidase family protein